MIDDKIMYNDEARRIDGNRLIAKYCGWKLEQIVDDTIKLEDDLWLFTKYDSNGNWMESYSGDDCEVLTRDSTLPYDYDWNWLVSAVRKCKTLTGSADYDGWNLFNEAIKRLDMDDIFEEVIEFLTWYKTKFG